MISESQLDERGHADPGGLLRAAAGSGALLRALAHRGGQNSRLGDIGAGDDFRALVLLGSAGSAAAAAPLQRAAALTGRRSEFPVVEVGLGIEPLPEWVGPLDLVVADTDTGEDSVLAHALHRASSRGARIVLTGPADGPVAAATAGAAVLDPGIPTPRGLGWVRAVGAGLLALGGQQAADELGALADAADEEALRCGPTEEAFVNPAKSLALRAAEHRYVLCGLDIGGSAVSRFAAERFAMHCSTFVCAVDYPSMAGEDAHLAAPEFCDPGAGLRHDLVQPNRSASIFDDPVESAETEPLPLRLDLIAAESTAHPERAQQAQERFPQAELLRPEVTVAGSGEDPLIGLVTLGVRVQLAALYLAAHGRSGAAPEVRP